MAKGDAEKKTDTSSETSDLAPASPQHGEVLSSGVTIEPSPLKGAESDSARQAEVSREAHAKRAAEFREQLEAERAAFKKAATPPDPGGHLKAIPLDVKGVHEAAQKGGPVPLPPGHKLNPPGSIPRAPGEWPSGAYPPENPQGLSVVGESRPASEPLAVAEKKREEAKKGVVKKPSDPPNPPDFPPVKPTGGTTTQPDGKFSSPIPGGSLTNVSGPLSGAEAFSSSLNQLVRTSQSGPIPGIDTLTAALAQLNPFIPFAIAGYRLIRDKIRQSGQDVPAFTDDQLISLVGESSDRVVARAEEFISKYSPQPPSPEPEPTPEEPDNPGN